jgi:hypothetical protein
MPPFFVIFASSLLLCVKVLLACRDQAPVLPQGSFVCLRNDASPPNGIAALAPFCGVASFFLALAPYLPQGRELSALASELVFTAMAGSFSMASLAAGRVARWLGRPPLVVGALGMETGLAWLRLTVGWIGVAGSPLLLVPALVLEGVGMGLVMAPLAGAVLPGLPARDAWPVAAVLVIMRQFANALGVALIGPVFFDVLEHARSGAGYTAAFGTYLDWLTGLALVLATSVRVLLGRNLPLSALPSCSDTERSAAR